MNKETLDKYDLNTFTYDLIELDGAVIVKATYDLINKNAHDLYLASPRLNPVDATGCPVYTDFNVCKLQAIGALLKWVVEAETPRPNDSRGLIRWLRTYEEITRYDIEASEKALAEYEAEHEEWKKKWGIEE